MDLTVSIAPVTTREFTAVVLAGFGAECVLIYLAFYSSPAPPCLHCIYALQASRKSLPSCMLTSIGRLTPLTSDHGDTPCPKALLPVGNRALLDYVLAWIEAGGVKGALLVSISLFFFAPDHRFTFLAKQISHYLQFFTLANAYIYHRRRPPLSHNPQTRHLEPHPLHAQPQPTHRPPDARRDRPLHAGHSSFIEARCFAHPQGQRLCRSSVRLGCAAEPDADKPVEQVPGGECGGRVCGDGVLVCACC